jgi:hypothetical protein
MAVTLVALGMHVIFGWWQAWIWLAVYIGVHVHGTAEEPLAAEEAAAKCHRRHPHRRLALCPSALMFGGLGPVLWVYGGQYGPALGIAVMASSLTNMVAISGGSRMAFPGLVGPFRHAPSA